MKTYTKDELKEILLKHKKWLFNRSGGKRADLSYAKLNFADLCSADLRHADLRHADLHHADLSFADLSSADLSGANLIGADLNHADLSYANLNLAKLNSVDLCYANLHYADLRFANLNFADLSYADLSRADLRSADLNYANLNFVDLNYAKAIDNVLIAYTNRCPQEGSFIAFKKADNKIVKLMIPEDAKRSNATSAKCRCNKAKVLGIYDTKCNLLDISEVRSDYDEKFIYKVGETVEVKNFDDNRWNECSAGIHFFLTYEMAVLYNG